MIFAIPFTTRRITKPISKKYFILSAYLLVRVICSCKLFSNFSIFNLFCTFSISDHYLLLFSNQNALCVLSICGWGTRFLRWYSLSRRGTMCEEKNRWTERCLVTQVPQKTVSANSQYRHFEWNQTHDHWTLQPFQRFSPSITISTNKNPFLANQFNFAFFVWKITLYWRGSIKRNEQI